MELYTEDTFEVNNEPYFGYMRGRYTPEDIRIIDDYGYDYGYENDYYQPAETNFFSVKWLVISVVIGIVIAIIVM